MFQYDFLNIPLLNNPFNVAETVASWLWFYHVLDGPRWISEHAVGWCAKRLGKRSQGGPGSLQKREGLAAQVGCPGCVRICWDFFWDQFIWVSTVEVKKKTVNIMRIVQHLFTFDDIWCWYHAWCLHTCQSIFYQRKFSSKTSKLRTNVQGQFCHHVHHIQ